MRVRHFVEAGLGNNAYPLISETERVAALIDPLRDAAARQEGVSIKTSL